MMAVFDNVQKASEAVARIIAAHILPCTLEFMDNMTINLVEDDVKIGLPRDAQAILLIEVDGHAGQVADEALIVEEQLKKSGATQIVVARTGSGKPAARPCPPWPASSPRPSLKTPPCPAPRSRP